MKLLIWGPDYVCKKQEKDFEDAGIELVRVTTEIPEDVIAASSGVDIIMIYGYSFGEEYVNALADSVKCLITMFVGVDNIGVKAATERGILVCSNPAYGSQEVAAQAITLIMNLNRKIYWYDKEMREDKDVWVNFYGKYPGHRLSDMTLGVIGMSRIGTYAVRRGKGLGMKVVAYDPYLPDSRFEAEGAERMELDDLLSVSDAITIHVPLMESTYHLLDAEKISKMKDGTIFVNTARAGLVDDDAMIEALKSGKIAAAGLDVFTNEPEVDPRLMELDNVIMTPHTAWYTAESERDIDILATELAADFSKGVTPYSCVNKNEIGARM